MSIVVAPGGSPVEVKPCPCCGSENLRIGPVAFLWYGVTCESCRLQMAKEVSSQRTKRTLSELNALALRQAIDAWNRRPSSPSPPKRAHKAPSPADGDDYTW